MCKLLVTPTLSDGTSRRCQGIILQQAAEEAKLTRAALVKLLKEKEENLTEEQLQQIGSVHQCSQKPKQGERFCGYHLNRDQEEIHQYVEVIGEKREEKKRKLELEKKIGKKEGGKKKDLSLENYVRCMARMGKKIDPSIFLNDLKDFSLSKDDKDEFFRCLGKFYFQKEEF